MEGCRFTCFSDYNSEAKENKVKIIITISCKHSNRQKKSVNNLQLSHSRFID